MKKRVFSMAVVAVIASVGMSVGSAQAGGANQSGPYTNDCQTTESCSPSKNGNGNGNATGRPDAGSVGNADGKNPPGQLPSAGADGNSGYECDTNSGVGKGNPAHSPCRRDDSA